MRYYKKLTIHGLSSTLNKIAKAHILGASFRVNLDALSILNIPKGFAETPDPSEAEFAAYELLKGHHPSAISAQKTFAALLGHKLDDFLSAEPGELLAEIREKQPALYLAAEKLTLIESIIGAPVFSLWLKKNWGVESRLLAAIMTKKTQSLTLNFVGDFGCPASLAKQLSITYNDATFFLQGLRVDVGEKSSFDPKHEVAFGGGEEFVKAA